MNAETNLAIGFRSVTMYLFVLSKTAGQIWVVPNFRPVFRSSAMTVDPPHLPTCMTCRLGIFIIGSGKTHSRVGGSEPGGEWYPWKYVRGLTAMLLNPYDKL